MPTIQQKAITNAKHITQLIIEEAKKDDYLGRWAVFCRNHGLTRHEVYFWRKKLGLVKAPTHTVEGP